MTQPGGRLLTLGKLFPLAVFFPTYNSLSPLLGIGGRGNQGTSLQGRCEVPGGPHKGKHGYVGRNPQGRRLSKACNGARTRHYGRWQ